MALASIIIFFIPVSLAIDSSCDYYQNMILGAQYYIYSPEYPLNYKAPTSCRWKADSQPGTRIVITCNHIDLPSSTSCEYSRLSFSLSGNNDLADSQNYCGKGTLSLISEKNSIVVGLFAPSNSLGGRFMCSLTAIYNSSSATTEFSNACDCGRKHKTRIVGGQETGINEYPFMAGLIDFVRRELYCGSTIISNRYVLSAAHCVINKEASNIGVLVGDHNTKLGSDTNASALYRVSAVKYHSNYNAATKVNDIALLKTKNQIIFSIYVGPVCLPFRYTSNNFNRQTATALGWGETYFTGPTSNVLLEVNLTVISTNECADEYPNPITDNQLCTYSPGKDSCHGDLGGPLLWMDTNTKRMQLIGIMSYGLACDSQIPGVNTRVTSYLSWIKKETTDAVYCMK